MAATGKGKPTGKQLAVQSPGATSKEAQLAVKAKKKALKHAPITKKRGDA